MVYCVVHLEAPQMKLRPGSRFHLTGFQLTRACRHLCRPQIVGKRYWGKSMEMMYLISLLQLIYQIQNLRQKPIDPTVPCCDFCSPALLNQTRPAPPSQAFHKKNVTPGIINKQLKKAIVKWWTEIWTHDFEDSLFGPFFLMQLSNPFHPLEI